MFDNNKIALNHLRANNTKNKKVSLFFDKLFEDVLDRLDISKRNAGNILEIQAKNNSLKKVL
ncbi:MAG: hypothetical protein VX089_05125, partial [Pseudomonadota bacterium]|nr:hypothetical protein [Pseudomonadota bacterium]